MREHRICRMIFIMVHITVAFYMLRFRWKCLVFIHSTSNSVRISVEKYIRFRLFNGANSHCPPYNTLSVYDQFFFSFIPFNNNNLYSSMLCVNICHYFMTIFILNSGIFLLFQKKKKSFRRKCLFLHENTWNRLIEFHLETLSRLFQLVFTGFKYSCYPWDRSLCLSIFIIFFRLIVSCVNN